VPLDGEIPAIDRTTQRGRGPERRPAEDRIRLAQLGEPGCGLHVEGRVIVRVRREARAVVEGGSQVEGEGRHGHTLPENVAAKSVTRVGS